MNLALYPNALYVVTGATGTIGKVVAEWLMHQGADVALLRRDPSKPVAGVLSRAVSVDLDLASPTSVGSAADSVLRLAGGREIVLAHIAGGIGTGYKGSSWLEAPVFRANALGPLMLMKSLGQPLQQVVAVSSSGTAQAMKWHKIKAGNLPGVMTQYCTAKAALEAEARRLSMEYRFTLQVAVPGVTAGGFFSGPPYGRKVLTSMAFIVKRVSAEDSAGAALRALGDHRVPTCTRVELKGGYLGMPARYEYLDLCPQAYDPEFTEWTNKLVRDFAASAQR